MSNQRFTLALHLPPAAFDLPLEDFDNAVIHELAELRLLARQEWAIRHITIPDTIPDHMQPPEPPQGP